MAENRNVAERFNRIAQLIGDARGWSENDDVLDAHLASYICVVLLGSIEYSVEELVYQRVTSVGDREVANYVTKVLGDRFRNPDWASLSGLLREFSEDYRTLWTERFPPNEAVHEALSNIVDIKNELAHRGTMALHVTLRDVQSYFERVSLAIDGFERIILPSTPTR